MKQVYQSKDGKIFESEQECLEYESKSSFRLWYYNQSIQNVLYNSDTKLTVDFNNLSDWLNKNKKEIINFLFPNDFIFLQELKSLIKKPLDVNDSNDVGILIDDIENLIQRYEKILENKI